MTLEIKFEHGKSPSEVLQNRNIGPIAYTFGTANVNIFLARAVVSWPDHRQRPKTDEHCLDAQLDPVPW